MRMVVSLKHDKSSKYFNPSKNIFYNRRIFLMLRSKKLWNYPHLGHVSGDDKSILMTLREKIHPSSSCTQTIRKVAETTIYGSQLVEAHRFVERVVSRYSFLSRSRISVSSFSSADGAGGAAGSLLFVSDRRLTNFTRRKTANATIRNEMIVLMNRP